MGAVIGGSAVSGALAVYCAVWGCEPLRIRFRNDSLSVLRTVELRVADSVSSRATLRPGQWMDLVHAPPRIDSHPILSFEMQSTSYRTVLPPYLGYGKGGALYLVLRADAQLYFSSIIDEPNSEAMCISPTVAGSGPEP